MSVPTVNCTHCGKNLTTDDLRRYDCRYCGTVLPHHARAQQQVAVVNQMLADRNGNGIPDAFEPLVMNAQANAMNQAFGMGPANYGAPAPPPFGYGANVQVVQQHYGMQQAHLATQRAVGQAFVWVMIGVGVAMAVLAGAVAFLMASV